MKTGLSRRMEPGGSRPLVAHGQPASERGPMVPRPAGQYQEGGERQIRDLWSPSAGRQFEARTDVGEELSETVSLPLVNSLSTRP